MENTERKKIVICEDHTIVYEGLRLLLEQSAHYVIIGHAESGKELINLLHKHQPDIVILDLNLPDEDGFTLLKEARKIYPHIRVVILTMYHDELLITKAKDEGANAYLLKNADNEELLKALDANNGEAFYLTKEIQKEISRKKMFSDRFAQKMKLTRREIEVIQRLARGHSTQQISEDLFLSQHTVDTHRKNIFRKLEINSTADLVRFAHENKLI